MNIDEVNGYLKAMATLNKGCDFNTDYSLKLVPSASSPEEAIDMYFNHGMWSQDISFSNERTEKPEWELSLTQVNEEFLREKLMQWFFNLPFSPDTNSNFQVDNAIGVLLDILSDADNYHKPFQIWSIKNVLKNYFYESMWDDLLIKQENKFYLLHLSTSD